MTMQPYHSPKPSIFGKGYGKHILYNLKIAKSFLKLAYKLFVNAFIPGKYYDVFEVFLFTRRFIPPPKNTSTKE